jgi:hypothetical protein
MLESVAITMPATRTPTASEAPKLLAPVVRAESPVVASTPRPSTRISPRLRRRELSGFGRSLRGILQPPREEAEAGTLGDRIAIEDAGFAGAEDAILLEALMRVLPDRERTVVVLRFRDDLLRTDIAELVGVSQKQVSRILSTAIGRLQEAAADESGGSRPEPAGDAGARGGYHRHRRGHRAEVAGRHL